MPKGVYKHKDTQGFQSGGKWNLKNGIVVDGVCYTKYMNHSNGKWTAQYPDGHKKTFTFDELPSHVKEIYTGKNLPILFTEWVDAIEAQTYDITYTNYFLANSGKAKRREGHRRRENNRQRRSEGYYVGGGRNIHRNFS